MKNIHLFRYFSFLLLVFVLYSCQKEIDCRKLLDNADKLMDSRPDSALNLLNTIQDVKRMRKSDFAEYTLLMVQAKDKNGLDISGDSLINKAVDYFRKNDDTKKTALAYFYANRVEKQQDHITTAINKCIQAKEYALKARDNNLLGLIYFDLGLIHKDQFDYHSSLQNFQKSRFYFKQAKNEKNEYYILDFIGDVYMMMKSPQLDSAFISFRTSLDYARRQKDSLKMSEILRSMGGAEKKYGNPVNSRIYFLESIRVCPSPKENFASYRNLSQIYLGMNSLDSAYYYIHRLSGVIYNTGKFNRWGYFDTQKEICRRRGEFEMALNHSEQMYNLNDSINQEIKKNNLMEIERKYDKSRLEIEMNEALIKKQQMIILVVISIFVIILLLIFSVWIFVTRNRIRKKKEEKIEELNQLLEKADRKEINRRKEELMEQLQIIKKAAYIKTVNSKEGAEVIDKIQKYFGKELNLESNWSLVGNILDELNDHFSEKISSRHPSFSEKELRTCCLIRAGFNTEDIALFLGYNKKQVNNLKYVLRIKTGCEDMIEFNQYLEQIM